MRNGMHTSAVFTYMLQVLIFSFCQTCLTELSVVTRFVTGQHFEIIVLKFLIAKATVSNSTVNARSS